MPLRDALLAAALVVGLVGCGEPASPDAADGFAVPDVESPATRGTTGGLITTKNELFALDVAPDPSPIPLNEPFALEITVARAEGAGAVVDDATLQLTARMPEHNHGMLRYPTTERIAPGHFRTEGMLFHMPGFWELVVNVQAGDAMDQATMRIDLE